MAITFISKRPLSSINQKWDKILAERSRMSSTTAQGENSFKNTLEKDPRWKLTERIVATPGFVKSARLSTFLLHIVRQFLSGNIESLTEQLIGERLFGRPIGYDPRDDNIVRSHASRLRQRLELYFQEEGHAESLRVTIPRGTYVPLFDRVENKPSESAPQTYQHKTEIVPLPEASTSERYTRRRQATILCGAVLGLLSVFIATRMMYQGPRHAVLQNYSPTYELWSELFSTNKETLVVPADSSLVVLKVFTGHTVSMSEYASGRYLADIICEKPCDRTLLQTLAAHRYTSTADLKFAVAVTHLPEALQDRIEIRYARDLQLDDLKQSNLILIGAPEANPWTGLFLPSMNFILQDDKAKGPLGIENRKPNPGESSQYPYNLGDPTHGYATVSFLPNLGGGGNILVVQGFSLADTEAASEFVTNRKDFDKLLGPIIGKQSALPHFELLLKTLDVNGIGSPPSLLAYRLYH
jgi:hypothetical protein